MKNKKRKSFIALLALVVLSGISAVSGTYAWWNVLQAKSEIEITVGDRITLEVTTDDDFVGQHLIPADVEDSIGGQVKELATNIKLNVRGEEFFDNIKLVVSEESRFFNNEALYADYFVVEINKTDIATGPITISPVTKTIDVKVRVTLVVPEDDQSDVLADKLALGTFKITLGFELLNKQNTD